MNILVHIDMPKNKGKGGKTRKRGKNAGTEIAGGATGKELVYREDGQMYAKVTKMLGNGRLLAQCFEEQVAPKLCIIPGAFRKRVWINMDDYILVSKRDYQDDKMDIIHKYSKIDAERLMKCGEIPYAEIDHSKPEEKNDLIEFTEETQEKQTKKKKSKKPNDPNASYIDESLLPPTETDQKKPELNLNTRIVKQKEETSSEDESSIDIDDL